MQNAKNAALTVINVLTHLKDVQSVTRLSIGSGEIINVIVMMVSGQMIMLLFVCLAIIGVLPATTGSPNVELVLPQALEIIIRLILLANAKSSIMIMEVTQFAGVAHSLILMELNVLPASQT